MTVYFILVILFYALELWLHYKNGIVKFESDSLCNEGGLILALVWPITLTIVILFFVPLYVISNCKYLSNKFDKI